MSPLPSENPPCEYSSSPTATRIFRTPRGRRQQILHGARVLAEKRNLKQQTIHHFQRSIKMKRSGKLGKYISSGMKEKDKFSCQYLTCGKGFTNQGALATHIKFKHPIISQIYLRKDHCSLCNLNLDCQSPNPLFPRVWFHTTLCLLLQFWHESLTFFLSLVKLKLKLQQQKLTKENSTKVRIIEIIGNSYLKREQSMSIWREKMWSNAQDE